MANGIITIDQAAIYKVYALFASPDLPIQYQSNILIPNDGLGAFATATRDWNQLLPETKQTINDFLSPRSVTQPSKAMTSTNTIWIAGCAMDGNRTSRNSNFIIWYSSAYCHITNVLGQENFLQAISDGLEDAYSTYHQVLNYTIPTGRPYPVYIVDVRSSYWFAGSPPALALRDAIFLDVNMGLKTAIEVKATAAHEYFHFVQWSYQSACPALGAFPGLTDAWFNYEDVRWWMEATGNWARHEAIPEDTGYFGWLKTQFLDTPWKRLDFHELFNTPPAYARFIFATYLAEHYQKDNIRQTWAQYRQSGGCGSILPSINQVVNVPQVFPDFAKTNYFLDYAEENTIRSSPGIGPDYRPRRSEQRLDQFNKVFSNVNRLPRDTNDISVAIEHLGVAYLDFTKVLTQPNQTLIFNVAIYATGSAPAANVYAVTQYSPTVVSLVTGTTLQQISSTRWQLSGRVANLENYEQVTVVIYNPGLDSSAGSMTFDYQAIVSHAVLYTGHDANAFISANGGATWKKFTFPNNVTIQATAAVTHTQGLVGYFGTSDLKLWKTIDGGQTFTVTQDFTPKVQGIITNTAFSLIMHDPTITNTVYVGMRGKTDPFWGPDKGALFKSTDGGQTFGTDLLTYCHTNHKPGDWYDCAITSLAIDPKNSNILWIGQDAWNSVAQAVMRSMDGGQTWQSVKSINNTFTHVSLSPIDSNVLWVLSQQQLDGQWVYQTGDSGVTWNVAKIDNTLNPASRTILADPFNVASSWACGGGEGVKYNEGWNLNWFWMAPESNALASINPRVLYAERQWDVGANSLQVSFDGGSSWVIIGHPDMIGGGSLSVVLP
jgi:hypothetical protein